MTQGQISVYGHKEICIIQKGTEARRKLVWIYAEMQTLLKNQDPSMKEKRIEIT